MEVLTLKGGLSLPLDVVLLALDLEIRRIKCVREGDVLSVRKIEGGKPDLTDQDRAQIRQWKHHLLALVDYCEIEH